MNTSRGVSKIVLAVLALTLVACSRAPAPTVTASTQDGSTSAAPAAAATRAALAGTSSAAFTPPPESSIPDNGFGALVRKGEAIFLHTQANAPEYVGNGLNCVNCHLDAGRRAGSAPLWAAWVRYPRWRAKNHKVNSYADRLQGCFTFSMNGKAPPADGDVIAALTAYSYWLAKGAPTGADKMPGVGYPDPGKPAQAPSFERGAAVFKTDCALCHGADGQGQKVAGAYVFPPLWGPQSFNWGAGMHRVNTAAAFIKANMPLSRGGTLTAQQAWDVAYYMDSHERPQDPRFTGDVATTRKQFHDNKWSLYGTTIDGHVLGSAPLQPRK